MYLSVHEGKHVKAWDTQGSIIAQMVEFLTDDQEPMDSKSNILCSKIFELFSP